MPLGHTIAYVIKLKDGVKYKTGITVNVDEKI